MMDIQAVVLEELKKVETEKGVRILYATESGSRSWGLASPDSDYDVRFVYVRPLEDYLRVEDLKDTIEWKLDEVLDINGWDLKKFMRLCAAGNVTPFEWMNSPITYFAAPEWNEITDVCKEYFSEKSSVNHYCGLATNTWFTHLTGDSVKDKKYFYALRPLFCAMYIEKYHAAPPMLFSELMKMEMDPELREAIDALLERKKASVEKAENPHIPPIREFIRAELDRQKAACREVKEDRNRDWEKINSCFAEIVRG